MSVNGHGTAVDDQHELGDNAFGYQAVVGALIGIPVTFAVVFLVLLIGTGKTAVTPALVWASLVAGPYLGGFLAVSLALGRIERRERAERQAARQGTLTKDVAKAA